MASKILVVGGFGYLGSIVTDMLVRRKNEVDVYDICMWGNEPDRSVLFSKHWRSLPDQEYDCVIWLAGIDVPSWYTNDLIIDSYLNKVLTDIKNLKSKNIVFCPPTISNPFIIKLMEVFKEKGACCLELSELYGPSPRMRWDTIPNKIIFDFITQGGVVVENMFEYIDVLSVYDAAEFIVNYMNNEIGCTYPKIVYQTYTVIELVSVVKKIIGTDNLTIGINGSFYKENNPDYPKYSISFKKVVEPLEKSIKSMLSQLEKNQFQDFTDDRYNNTTCVANMKMGINLVERLKI
jgi:nucleoside-diphosphate-sugar epimerase